MQTVGSAEPASAPASRSASATKIYPYEPPRQLASNLWQVKGSLAIGAIPRNMTVYRLADGRLVLYSVVAMHEDGLRALEALGTPAIMVMPHDRHQMDAPFYLQRYPQIRILAPEPEAPRNVPVAAGLGELAELGIRAYPLPGTSYHEVILELPVPGGYVLCACELLSDLVPSPRGLVGLFFKMLGPPGGGFGVARAVRWREVVDRAAVREWLVGLAARRDLVCLLVGHGSPVTKDVAGALRHALAGA
jgi:hypothetical protein